MRKQNIRRGEIYYADLDPVVGSEQGGIRPVLVIQNDIGNQFSPTIIVAAITGKTKKDLPTHVPLQTEQLPQQSVVMLEQIRTIDKKRVDNLVGEVDDLQMKDVEKAIDISLGKYSVEALYHD